MKPIFRTFICLLLVLIITSCKKKNKEMEIKQKPAIENQVKEKYIIDTEGVSVLWTAYKFTNRVGVSGTFRDVVFETNNATGIMDSILYNSKVTIPTLSVNSNNEIRDPKLRKIFFKTFDTDTIRGKITKVDGDRGLVEIQMNTIKKEVPYSKSIRNDTLVFQTHLDLNEWNGNQAIKALNKECYELHTGKDGISKLWPDVAIEIKLPLVGL